MVGIFLSVGKGCTQQEEAKDPALRDARVTANLTGQKMTAELALL